MRRRCTTVAPPWRRRGAAVAPPWDFLGRSCRHRGASMAVEKSTVEFSWAVVVPPWRLDGHGKNHRCTTVAPPWIFMRGCLVRRIARRGLWGGQGGEGATPGPNTPEASGMPPVCLGRPRACLGTRPRAKGPPGPRGPARLPGFGPSLPGALTRPGPGEILEVWGPGNPEKWNLKKY